MRRVRGAVATGAMRQPRRTPAPTPKYRPTRSPEAPPFRTARLTVFMEQREHDRVR